VIAPRLSALLLLIACDDPASQGSSASLRALESRIDCRTGYGEGPDAEGIARALHDTVGGCIAVRVVPGVPRRIVVLIEAEGGRGALDDAMTTIDNVYGAGDAELGVAIKSPVAYEAIAIRQPDRAARYDRPHAALEPLLTRRPGPEPSSVITIGATIEGAIPPYPRPQPAYHLTLDERHLVRVRLTSDRLEDGPVAAVCGGHRRAGACDEDVVFEPRDDVGPGLLAEQAAAEAEATTAGRSFVEEVYELNAGLYTIGVFRTECGEDGRCGSDRAQFTLRLLD
jgi:hypothetical protein